MSNRMVKLARRPKGMIVRDDFKLEDGPVPEPGDGQFRVRIEYISLDPAMRGWINEGKSYVPPVAIGETMRATRPASWRSPIIQTSNPAMPCKACSACSAMRCPTASASSRSIPPRRRCSAGLAASACRAGRPILACSRSASPRPAKPWSYRRRQARSAPSSARSPRSRAAARSALPAGRTSAAMSRRSSASMPASTTRPAISQPTSRRQRPRASMSISRTSAAKFSIPY